MSIILLTKQPETEQDKEGRVISGPLIFCIWKMINIKIKVSTKKYYQVQKIRKTFFFQIFILDIGQNHNVQYDIFILLYF